MIEGWRIPLTSLHLNIHFIPNPSISVTELLIRLGDYIGKIKLPFNNNKKYSNSYHSGENYTFFFEIPELHNFCFISDPEPVFPYRYVKTKVNVSPEGEYDILSEELGR